VPANASTASNAPIFLKLKTTSRRTHPIVFAIAVYITTPAAKLHQKFYNFIYSIGTMQDHSDHAEIAESVRSGAYFQQSRDWYRTIYIGPISERTFFLIIAILATTVAAGAILALMEFLPIVVHSPIVLANDHLEETVPSISPLRAEGQKLNPALMNFFVSSYITSYEGYDATSYITSFNFVQAHSDATTFSNYAGIYGSNNPQSPAAILGTTGQREVTVDSIVINDKITPHTAQVHFTTELFGIPTANKTRWTATLQFYYSDLTVTEKISPETGKHFITTKAPQFQVVNYAVSQVR
jgi:type IV secretory pathway component VirB8